MDSLVERFGAADIADVAAARKVYEGRRGRVFEDEVLWETVSQGFVEWYLLERVPPGRSRPLAAALLESELSAEQRAALLAWLDSYRSLFEVVGLSRGRVDLVDLLGGSRLSIGEQRTFHGVAVGDVVEARLLGCGADVVFGRSFLYHPTGVREPIRHYVEQRRGTGADRRDLIDHFAWMRVRCERYKHLNPIKIYDGSARLRETESHAE